MVDKSLLRSTERDGLPTAPDHSLDAHNKTSLEANGINSASEYERKILQEQIDVPVVKTTYTSLYGFSTAADMAIIIFSAA
jgi:hypothetical protein